MNAGIYSVFEADFDAVQGLKEARTALCFTLHHTVRFTPILARDFDCLQMGDDTIVIIKSHRMRNVQRAFRSLLSNASMSGRSMSISS